MIITSYALHWPARKPVHRAGGSAWGGRPKPRWNPTRQGKRAGVSDQP